MYDSSGKSTLVQYKYVSKTGFNPLLKVALKLENTLQRGSISVASDLWTGS